MTSRTKFVVVCLVGVLGVLGIRVLGKPMRPMPPGTFFAETFSVNSVIEESGSLLASSHDRWWVNSGGRLIFSSGSGTTIQGEVGEGDPWLGRYAKSNPQDTDGGRHPQNIFRLVQTDLWHNYAERMYVKINRINMSASPNRDASNGIFLFNRYQSGEDLYYAGVRVDGMAVIKKKRAGTYYTLAMTPLFPDVSSDSYDRDTNPNLLPVNTWFGLKSEVRTNTDDSVTVDLYVDPDRSGNWILVLSATDNGSLGGTPITAAGYAGVRTDFMDVEFGDYRIEAF